ncbi:MAG: rhodanese protein [Paenibacillaceae bacterium]|nr:rhodanese protein [Paenibacillaceae bacterium]
MLKHKWKEVMPREVAGKLKKGEPLHIIDVREAYEWRSGHIPGAKHIPLAELPERLRELSPKQENILVCMSGGRSTRACEYLSQLGYKVVNMKGGMSAWTGDVV